MYARMFPFGFLCLRDLFFLSLLHSFAVYGFAKGSDKITEKIFVNSFPKEDNIEILGANRAEGGAMLNKSKNVNLNDRLHQNNFKKQQIDNVRQKRNALTADEDLFEFMVRIANTPVEWERIRRVLSRIKPEEKNRPASHSSKIAAPDVSKLFAENEIPHATPTSHNKSSMIIVENYDRHPVASRSMRNSIEYKSADKWPSTEWIKNLIRNTTNEDYYNDEEDYINGDAEEDELEESVPTMDKRKSSSANQTNPFDESKMIIPNAELPNFVYRRVIPNSSDPAENSAYIAVSVVSPNIFNQTQPHTTNLTSTTINDQS